MRKQELVDMLKQAWTDALMDEKDLREDLADSYASWVQGLIESAAPELSGQQQGQGQGQQQGGAPAQGGGPPPEQGGGAPMPQAGVLPAGGMA